jgi:pimeloyl-ACP methyl ester carboxylesterase
VEAVDAGSPAQRAGLQVGDALLALAGSSPRDLDDARALVARLPVTAAVPLLVQRAGLRVELSVQAEPLPLEALGVGEIVLDEVPWREHRLRAVWTFPTTESAPVPAIWLLPGAAWLSEEHPIEPRSARLALVRGLTQAGFATLRVERSGLGDSEGPPCTELDLHAELEGWRAAREHFCRHARVLPSARFLYARSLGGMLAPLLAERGDFAALAVWGSSAQPWSLGMLAAAERQYRLAGRSGPALARTLAQLTELSRLIYDEALTPEVAYQRRPDLSDTEPASFAGRAVYGRVASFFQQLSATDIAAAWRSVRCPVLALHGSSDWLSAAEDSAEIARLAPAGEYGELTGIDHMMHSRRSVEEAFAEPWGGDFSPVALHALVSFYKRHWPR